MTSLENIHLRYFSVCDARQRRDEKLAYGGIVCIFLDKLLKNMPPEVQGDGEQTRGFVYVKDMDEASMLALRASGAAGEFSA
jgi:nucleoside-diphosphate-sugar epimerase